MTLVIHEQRQTQWPPQGRQARADGDALWLDADAVAQATGWDWKPQGLCRGEVCLPLPPAGTDAAAALVRDDRLDIAALWRRSGYPVVRDAFGERWVLGTGAAERGAALRSLQAPEFELPDLDGRMHGLLQQRGRRVFLATWASW